MKTPILLMVMFIALFSHASVEAAIYKWVDANGTVSFRDTPPVQDVDAATVTLPELNVVNMPAAKLHQPSAASPASQSGMTGTVRAEVDLYTTTWCGYCKQAKAFLRQRGIAYREYDVEKDPAAAERKRQLGGGSGVPCAMINGKAIRGFSAAAYAAALR